MDASSANYVVCPSCDSPKGRVYSLIGTDEDPIHAEILCGECGRFYEWSKQEFKFGDGDRAVPHTSGTPTLERLSPAPASTTATPTREGNDRDRSIPKHVDIFRTDWSNGFQAVVARVLQNGVIVLFDRRFEEWFENPLLDLEGHVIDWSDLDRIHEGFRGSYSGATLPHGPNACSFRHGENLPFVAVSP